MEPSNKKERTIAKLIEDRCCQADSCTYPLVLPEVLNEVGFLLSPTDTQFLVRYVKQRCPTPEK
jgi:hypothetical protein